MIKITTFSATIVVKTGKIHTTDPNSMTMMKKMRQNQKPSPNQDVVKLVIAATRIN